MSFNKRHPECSDDEVFVSNSDDIMWGMIRLKTKRKGIVAYLPSGDAVEDAVWHGVFPVFAKKAEVMNINPVYVKFMCGG